MIDFAQRRRGSLLQRAWFPKSRKKRRISFFVVTLVFALVVFLGIALVFAWYSRDLPDPNNVQRREGFSTVIMDRDGKVLYDIYADENRVPVKLDQISDHLEHATVAIEDKDFYTHQGYSTKGMVRAFIQIVIYRDLQGGSTLTQQLVKNVLLSSERTLPRKIKEFILAVQIEKRYSKDEILQMYLNEAPYGGTAWGVESAAKLYFDKPAKQLSLLESAILAGMPQSPSVYSPYSGEEDAYIERTKHVLRRMREDNYITELEEEQALKQLQSVTFTGADSSFDAPHFVMYVKKLLIDQFGEETVERGGLQVKTTIDGNLQRAAEDILDEEIEKLESLDVGNGALIALDPNTGEILAMVGSRDYSADENDLQGKFNVATQGLRQPGSALKPIVYATAFEKGYTPSTMLLDVRTEYPGGVDEKPYAPENYDGKYHGPMQMRFALGNSINTVAVKTLALVGVEDMLENAYAMGLSTLEPTEENKKRFGLSVSLGGGEVKLIELASAYGVFASGGIHHETAALLEVKDKDGKTIFTYKPTKGEQVLSEDVSYLISHILSDNNARSDVFGTNSWLNIPGKTVAVKTGTTDDKRDNWTVGYTKDFVLGVWVGNNDNSPMNPKLASGVTGAAPIWNRVMKEALKTYDDSIQDKPKNVIALEIDALGGGLPKDGQTVRSEYFIEGTEPTSQSPIYQKLKLSRNQNGKRASQSEIDNGEYDEKDYIVLSEYDPVSSDGKNRWQDAINAWIDSQGDDRYKFPRETSDHMVDKKSEEPTKTPTPQVTKSPESTPTPTPTP